jgi:hypothetical protein
MISKLMPLLSLRGGSGLVPLAVTDVDRVTAFLAGRKLSTLKAYAQGSKDLTACSGSADERRPVDLLASCPPGQTNELALG